MPTLYSLFYTVPPSSLIHSESSEVDLCHLQRPRIEQPNCNFFFLMKPVRQNSRIPGLRSSTDLLLCVWKVKQLLNAPVFFQVG